jgi:hypothetical protein
MGCLIPALVVLGGFIIMVGAAVFYYGFKMPKDKKIAWGFGVYYSRIGVCFYACFIMTIGVITLVGGVVAQ